MKTTKTKLRNLFIYQVYVRNHTEEGTFNALVKDLDRIKELGVDIVYLLPIHPIGVKNRKGSLGCPYSIQDYRKINPELGTLSDFQNLIKEVHSRGMKIMMDVVYNHTSRDSRLLEEHPEWFYKDETGKPANRVGEWSDVYDLDYHVDKGLWHELIDTLEYYAKMGVDGYRCDVASMVPLEFWQKARKAINRINHNFVWLSESVHGYFCKILRDSGFACASEAEIYQAFDMAYDYDVQPDIYNYLNGKAPLRPYLDSLERQEEIYPHNYVKMRNLDNHDCVRIAKFVDKDLEKVKNWYAFSAFQKGAFMVYAGGEFATTITPNLFDKQMFDKNHDLSEFIRKLADIKKHKLFADGIHKIHYPEIDGVAYNTFENDKMLYVGIFNVGQSEGYIDVDLKDGRYRNYLDRKIISVKAGKMKLRKEPIILRLRKN